MPCLLFHGSVGQLLLKPEQLDAIARELKYHGSCRARYTMPTERLWDYLLDGH